MNMVDPYFPYDWYATVLADHAVRVEIASFVALLISRRAIARVGLPIKEFFVWNDDVEFTRRISRHFKNYLILDSVAVHKTERNASSREIGRSDSVKYCYGLRNQVATVKLDPISWHRKVLKIGGLLRRQILMIVRGRAPFRVLFWWVRGVFFRARIGSA
jgi:GT2 family glycosyltransferase